MKKLPYYPMYPKDFDTDHAIRVMTDEELGFFLRLLNHAWTNDGLEGDLEEIRRAMREPSETFSRKWIRAEPCFQISADGRRRNPRQESERELAKVKSGKAAEAASKRWSNANASKSDANACETDANASPGHCQRNARAYESVSVSASVYEVLQEENSETRETLAEPARSPDGFPIPDPHFRRIINAFVAGGAALNDRDLNAAAQEYLSVPEEQREMAAIASETHAMQSEARFLGLPSNWLKKRVWTRRSVPRAIPNPRPPSKAELAQAEAARDFLREAM